ncbi:hypothetical protein H7200_02315 [Candidatus Saccharibacteria bacterium]|nr:hypothetical protein [Candidatus Saccharibacteria bacterium]
MKTLKLVAIRTFVAVLAVATLVPALSTMVSAAQITNRSVTIGSSAASASTSYTFNFTVPTTTAVKSASFTACTTASGACTTPAGFSITGSSLASQPTGLGSATGWTANTATAGSLRILNAANATASSGSQSVVFSAVTNPSATNSTYFFRIATFSDSAWTTSIDNGTVATSTAGQVTVTASVDETLTFTLSSSTVALGTLTSSATNSGTSTMSASTNATSGYAVTVNGTTLTSGGNTITALASPTASTIGSKQFGLNLVANTTPAVGTAVSGTGTGTAQTGYNTTNQFKFVTGDTVAAATGPTNNNAYTMSYISNIDPVTNPGAYSTVLTYVATANF